MHLGLTEESGYGYGYGCDCDCEQNPLVHCQICSKIDGRKRE